MRNFKSILFIENERKRTLFYRFFFSTPDPFPLNLFSSHSSLPLYLPLLAAFPPNLPPLLLLPLFPSQNAGRHLPGRLLCHLPAGGSLHRRDPRRKSVPARPVAGGRRGQAGLASDYRGSGGGSGVGGLGREQRRCWPGGDPGAGRRSRRGHRDSLRLGEESPGCPGGPLRESF